MKKSVSPGVVVLIIAVLVIIIGLVFMKGGGPGAKQEAMDAAIKGSVVTGKGNAPVGVMPKAGGPAPTTTTPAPAPK